MPVQPLRRLRSASWRLVLSALAFAAMSALPARAQETAPFYAGKTVKLLTGAPVGAAYDLVGRAVAAHLGRHLKGNPTVIVENMPGAASVIMLNHLYNRVARDGLTFGLSLNGIVLESRLKVLSRDGSNVRFDASKLGWLGSPAQEPIILFVWHATPYKSVLDLKGAGINFGTSSQGTDNYVLPIVANRALGTDIKVTAGYKGVGDIFLAIERGELQGAAVLSSNLAAKPDWLAANKARVLVHFGTGRSKRWPDVPSILEVTPSAEHRELLSIYAGKFKATYPFMVPPEVPAERVAELRAAFAASFKDPRFIADAAKVGIDVDPVSGAEIAALIARIEAVPQPVIDRLRKLVE